LAVRRLTRSSLWKASQEASSCFPPLQDKQCAHGRRGKRCLLPRPGENNLAKVQYSDDKSGWGGEGR
jgi:hypothetical protein